MDPDELESGLDNASDSSEEFEPVDDLTSYEEEQAEDTDDAEPEDEEREADPTDETDESDLPEYRADDYSAEERERLLAALGDDAIGTIDQIVERRVQAALAGSAHANIHLAREAQRSPELYRMYGAQAQAILSKMKPQLAGTKQGVQMATIGAIAMEVQKTGDLVGTLEKVSKALQKGRTIPAETPKAKLLPPEARTPSPSVGRRPSNGTRPTQARQETVVNALAEMVGSSPTRARNYFEEE